MTFSKKVTSGKRHGSSGKTPKENVKVSNIKVQTPHDQKNQECQN
jgi:hypothetical protein